MKKSLALLVVVSFISSGVLGSVREDIDVLNNTLHNVNSILKTRNLEEIPFEDFSFHGIFRSLLLTNGSFGDFSTLSLNREGQLLTKQVYGTTVVYLYDVKVGLDSLHFGYNFYYKDFIFRIPGTVMIRALNNEIHVRGTLLLPNDGGCKAYLISGEVTKFSEQKVQIQPDNFITKILRFMSQVYRNFFGSTGFKIIINKYISDHLNDEDFRTFYSEIVCEAAGFGPKPSTESLPTKPTIEDPTTTPLEPRTSEDPYTYNTTDEPSESTIDVSTVDHEAAK